MAARFLYIARHGMADAFGELTDTGHRQAHLLGQRLAEIPVDAVWHSPLPRATASAHELAPHLPAAPITEAAELIDNVPYVPTAEEMPAAWAGFFDGYDRDEAASGQSIAERLIDRFARPHDSMRDPHSAEHGDRHEVLITHAYPLAWLVRHAMGAAPTRWLSLTSSANAALTVIEYRPGLAPSIVMFNDMSHLPGPLRWTGFPAGVRP